MLRTTDDAFKRMIEEEEQLSEKLTRLELFINKCRKNEVNDITLDEIKLMEEQAHAMSTYRFILRIRIARVRGGHNA